MILTGPEIAREVRAGRIVIEPLDPSGCNPNSYDYRLGDEYIELSPSNGSNGAFRESPRRTIPPDGLLLQPQNLYLCHTLEKLGSDHYVTSLIGKSSMGRLGLFLQISADLGHQGEIHQWT